MKNISIINVYLPQPQCKNAKYEETLNNLEALVKSCHMNGTVIVIGDVNAQLGEEGGQRGWGPTSVNGKTLLEFAQRNMMQIYDLLESTTGPRYTCYSHWGSVSYIDHCLVSGELSTYIKKCMIMEEDLRNTSDHLPLRMEISCLGNLNIITEQTTLSKVAWEKLTSDEMTNLYAIPLQLLLNEFIPQTEDEHIGTSDKTHDEIDNIITQLSNAMFKCADRLPKKQFKKHLRPYWNKELQAVSKEQKQLRYAWIMAGRPRAQNSEIYKKYKEAKRHFRKSFRLAEYTYQVEQQRNMVNNEEIDQKVFWAHVNKQRKSNKQGLPINPLKDDKGNLITEPDDLVEEWRDYFKELATPKMEPHFDKEFHVNIEQELHDMSISSEDAPNLFLDNPITL